MGVNFVLGIVFLRFAYFTGVQSGEYLGCFRDNGNSRILPDVYLKNYRHNSPSTCTHICGRLGFKLAGVQASFECFCGNVIPSTKINEDQCGSTCPQDSSLKCGGGMANGVYRTDDQTSVQAGEYLGCFRDNVNSRTLPDVYLANHRDNSPSTCAHICRRLGFKLAGVQVSVDCCCGNVIPSTKIDEDKCGMPCPQNSSLKCGGDLANGVYRTDDQITTTVPTTTMSTEATVSTEESVCRVFMDLQYLNVVRINGNSCQYRCIHKTSKKGVTIFKKDGEVCNNGHGICLKGVCQEADQNTSCPKGFYGVGNLCKVFCYSLEHQGTAVVKSMQEGGICIDKQDYHGTCVNGKCVLSLEKPN